MSRSSNTYSNETKVISLIPFIPKIGDVINK